MERRRFDQRRIEWEGPHETHVGQRKRECSRETGINREEDRNTKE